MQTAKYFAIFSGGSSRLVQKLSSLETKSNPKTGINEMLQERYEDLLSSNGMINGAICHGVGWLEADVVHGVMQRNNFKIHKGNNDTIQNNSVIHYGKLFASSYVNVGPTARVL